MNKIIKRFLRYLMPTFFWLLLFASFGLAQEVVLPLTLDHTLLTSLLVHNGFGDKDQGISLVGEDDACTDVRISEPQFSSDGPLLRLDMRLDIQVGTELGESCLTPLAWHGYVQLLLQPLFDGRTFSLSFQTVDSHLLTLSRKPATVADFLWKFAKPRVYAHLDRIRLDLAPPIAELRSFLAPLFPEESLQATRAMLDSIHGGQVVVGKEAVVVELLTEVQQVFEPKKEQLGAELTEEERGRLVKLWETWDAFLVRLLVTMAGQPLLPEDRQTLIEVLLDTRYVFIAALDNQEIGRDFVRMQFLQAWHQLAPVFRRQLYARPSDNSLGYLAFFTAADALAVFDRLGPTLGIEISQQGLLRLAAMVVGGETALPYGTQLDEQLRGLLQLPPIDEEESLPDNQEEIDIPVEEPAGEPHSRLFDFFSTPAYGAEKPALAEILRWRVPEKDLAEYVARVKTVLAESSATLLARGEIPKQFHGMFNELIIAMAWQESCFRQFTVKNKKLTYLLSYNQTSVGLMQVNERVWRGVYDRSRLRWDIHYNALAGCEIADLYLRTYAFKHPIWQNGADTRLLSQVVYAMYNGGPRQYAKFLARQRSGKLYRSDQLFLEKLQWVGKGEWQHLDDCLGGI